MSDITAQDVQKLLTDVIRKQMIILGPQITLLKARNVHTLNVADDGSVLSVSGNPQAAVTEFLEQFRDLSAPLVKKTMQPLLSSISSTTPPTVTTTPAVTSTQSTGNHSDEILIPKI